MQAGANLGSKAGFGLLDLAMTVPTAGLWPLGRLAAKQVAMKKPSPKSRLPARPVAAGAAVASERSTPNRDRLTELYLSN
jgi:hypothetical protein